MTLSRRRFLHRSAVVVGGIGLAGAVAARSPAAEIKVAQTKVAQTKVAQTKVAQTKVAQNLVGYMDSPQGSQECDNCQYFEPPNGCKVVAGTISPKGWCKMWAKKS